MKRIMVKTACAILAVCLMTSLFVGCGAKENKEASASSTTTTASSESSAKPATAEAAASKTTAEPAGKSSPYNVTSPVQLQVFHYMGEQFKRDGLDALLKAVSAKNPNITFEITAIAYAQYSPLLQTKIASGDVPDIMTNRPQNQKELVAGGVFMELTNEPFIKNIQEAALLEQKVDNKIWSVPIDFTAFGVLYNKKMFEKYNLKEPTTLTEMLNICETFKKNGIVPFIHPFKDANQPGVEFNSFFYTMSYLYDRKVYGDLRTKTRKFSDIELIQKGLQIYDKYLAYTDPGDIATDPTQAISIFASEQRPMFICGLWTIGDIRKANPNGDFGFFPTPWSDNPKENMLNFSVDDSFVASASTKHPEAVLYTLDFIASDEGAQIWSSSTKLMSTSASKAVTNNATEPVILTAYNYFDKGMATFRKDITSLSGESSQKFRTAMQWMVSLAPSERTLDKVIKYFDKEFETIQ